MRAIAVFCASSHGRDAAFAAAARDFGALVARQALTLVYGGELIHSVG